MTAAAPGTAQTAALTAEVLDELDALADPAVLAISRKHGDDHAVKLGELRKIAARLKAQPELARSLWTEDSSAAKLVAVLVSRPSHYDARELDRMLRSAGTPKVRDWLLSNLIKKSKHREALRQAWFEDPDPVVASAGWALTSQRVLKDPDGIDQAALLDRIEAEMQDAPEPLQWAMNETLAQIGITNAQLRDRARAIGERLGVLKDYPTPPNCTSPYAPIWIDEMVARAEQA